VIAFCIYKCYMIKDLLQNKVFEPQALLFRLLIFKYEAQADFETSLRLLQISLSRITPELYSCSFFPTLFDEVNHSDLL